MRNILIDEGFDGQEVDDGHGHRNTTHQNAKEIAKPGPNDGNPWFQGVGVNDRGYGIGGVVKPIDKLKRASRNKA
jgi:hypothetical protein